MTAPLRVPTLSGSLVRLEPLSPQHAPDLVDAATEEISTYGYTVVPRTPEEVEAYIATQELQARQAVMIPFAQVRLTDGRAVGTTALFALRYREGSTSPFAVEIGWTWLAASAQRSGINREAKLLLMTYAFGELGVVRVDLKTDARNDRSRQAIAGLGAHFEGVLRCWQPSYALGEEERYRDTAMFSVTATEWPTVAADLGARIRR